jgi:hypothetical protein
MKKFNQTISVEVSVDSIAEKLWSTFDPNFAHAELLTESIIGSNLESGKLGYVYNALNGFNNDIDFQVGQTVDCKESIYSWVPEVDSSTSTLKGTYRREYMPLGKATIVEINLYKSDKLLVEYNTLNSKGDYITETKWVDHRACSGLSTVPCL